MTDSTASRRPRVDAARVRHQRARSRVLLYNVATDATFETNDTGLEILRQLDGTCTCRQVAARLAARYAGPPDAILTDVCEFLQALERHGFVEGI